MVRRVLQRMVGALRRHRERWLAPLVFVVLATWLYRDLWYAPDDQKTARWYGWDCIESYWPDLAYYGGALAHGEAPLWNPYDRGGFAFYADTTPGLYYPLTWAFVVPGAVAGEMPGWTQQLKMLVHHVLCGLLLYVFLRRRKLPWPAALVGGVAFMLSAPMFIHKASALLWNVAWTPLIWIATDAALERAKDPGWWRRAAALAGAIGLAGAAGPPPAFFYALLAALAYGGLRLTHVVLDARRAGRLRPELRAQARVLGVAAAVTIALLAVIVVPGLDVAAESATRGAARDLAYALGGSLPPGTTLVGAFAPTGGEPYIYMGLLVPILVAVALATRPTADRGVPVLFVGLGVVTLLLAFGRNGHVLPWLVQHAPAFGLFREPNRYKIITTMAFAVVAAHGVAALLDADARLRRRALITAGIATGAIAIAVAIIAAASGLHRAPEHPGYALSFVVLAIAVALVIAVLRAPARWRVQLVCAMVALIYFDVTRFGYHMLESREAPVDDQEDRRYLAGLGDVEREWRIYDEFVMEQRPGSRLRVRDFRGYPSGDPFDDARYAEVRARLKRDPELLAAYNVRWVLWGPHHRNQLSKNFVARRPDQAAPLRFRQLDARRFAVIDPAPQVVWYGAIAPAKDRREALDLVALQEKLPGQRRRAIVETADRPDDPGHLAAVAPPPDPVTGRIVDYAANRVAFDIVAPAAGVVVLNEKLLAGWRVEVDGAAARGFRANYLLRAVTVPAGRHTVVWTYHPPRFALLFGAWLAGVAFVVAAGVAALRSRRRSRIASTSAPISARIDSTDSAR